MHLAPSQDTAPGHPDSYDEDGFPTRPDAWKSSMRLFKRVDYPGESFGDKTGAEV
jgi:hypothetical protein